MIQNAFQVPGTQSVSNKRLLSIEKQNTGVRSMYIQSGLRKTWYIVVQVAASC